MTAAASEDTGAEKFELELYKILKSESSTYLDKLQALWLQRFVLVGAVIAFLVTNQEMLSGKGYGIMVAAAIFTIPVLAALLDAKILEFSLHARSISRFIDSHFVTLRTVTRWERVLWGLEGAPEDLKIARVRHLTTVLVAIVPTIVIWLLASIALGQLTGQDSIWRSLGVLGGVAYALVTWLSWRITWAGTR